MTQEHFPEFFEQAPTLTVQDALAEFLGAAEEGIMQYRYADAVRLCGHSCPTVAGAYLMTLKGLKALYGSDLPQRGGIEAAMQGAADDGDEAATVVGGMARFVLQEGFDVHDDFLFDVSDDFFVSIGRLKNKSTHHTHHDYHPQRQLPHRRQPHPQQR